MLVRMIHEKHGEHICYAQWEIDQCLANGWKFKVPDIEPEIPEPPKKRGRPKKVDK